VGVSAQGYSFDTVTSLSCKVSFLYLGQHGKPFGMSLNRFYALHFILLSFVTGNFAQELITFEKIYGANQSDIGYAAQQTIDGGYILFGNTSAWPDYKYSWKLIKTDSLGEVQWQKTYGDEYLIGNGNVVQQTTDGGYIVCGAFGGPFTDSLVLMKTDDLGNQIWIHAYPITIGRSIGQFVEETDDGGFIITGYAGKIMEEDVYTIKTNMNGIEEWSRTIGGPGREYGNCVRQTVEGDFIVMGETNSYGNGGYDMYVLKFNNTGDTIWTKTYGTASNEGGETMDLTSDGGFIGLGGSSHQIRDFYVVKADAGGKVIWSQEYGGDGWDYGYAIQQTQDGGYFLAGRLGLSAILPSEMHCIRTNATGDVLWERGFRKGTSSEAVSAMQTADGGYFVFGTATFTNPGLTKSYMYLAKLDAMGQLASPENAERKYTFQICPNPFLQTTLIKFDEPLDADYSLILYDALGREIGIQSGAAHDEIYLERNDLPAALYFFEIISGNRVIGQGKLIAK
jgi:hypothetical protein